MADAVSQPRGVRRLDPHFRWRSTAATRLEGLTDAVFAIVLALLFLRAEPPGSFADLQAAMKSLAPFAAMFAIIAYVWVESWLFSRRYELRDGWATFLQLLLLFLLLFYAYPLKFFFTLLSCALFGPIGELTAEKMTEGMTSGDIVVLWAFYGVGYGLIFAVIGLLYWRAHALADELGLDEIERFLTRSAILQCAIQVAIAIASITLAAAGIGLRHGAPGWLYACIGPLMAVHGFWQGRRVERMRPA